MDGHRQRKGTQDIWKELLQTGFISVYGGKVQQGDNRNTLWVGQHGPLRQASGLMHSQGGIRHWLPPSARPGPSPIPVADYGQAGL